MTRITREFSNVAVSTTSNPVLAATSQSGLNIYITDISFANSSASPVLVTVYSGTTTAIGYAYVPATANTGLVGLTTPIKTAATSKGIYFSPSAAVSSLYVTCNGFYSS